MFFLNFSPVQAAPELTKIQYAALVVPSSVTVPFAVGKLRHGVTNSIVSTMQQLQGWGHQQGLHPEPAGSTMPVSQPCVPPVPPTTRPPPPAPRSPSFLPVQLQLPSGAGSQDMWQDGSRADFVPAASPLLAFPAASTLQLGSTTGRGNARVTRCRRGENGKQADPGRAPPARCSALRPAAFFPPEP